MMRAMVRSRLGALGFGFFALVALSPGAATGQVVGEEARSLERTAGEVLSLWEVGRLAEMSSLLASEGVRVDLGRGERSGLSSRQVLAALRDFLGGQGSRATRIVRVSEVGGDPPRGFAEMSWEAVAPGASEAVHLSLFFGFVEEDRAWRVSEIRLLR